MSKKAKIAVAIIGGAAVGALGVCGVIWPEQGMLFATASGLVAMTVASITGFVITKQ